MYQRNNIHIHPNEGFVIRLSCSVAGPWDDDDGDQTHHFQHGVHGDNDILVKWSDNDK